MRPYLETTVPNFLFAEDAPDTRQVMEGWNMAHLVNMRKVERINAVNERAGLPRIRIHTPEEVLDL